MEILNFEIVRPLVPKQIAYWSDQARYTFIDGSKYSGKSFINSLIYPVWMSIKYYGFKYIIVAASNATLTDTILPLYTNLLNDYPQFFDAIFKEVYKSSPYRWITHNNSEIKCMEENPVSDPDFSKILKGVRYTSANICEAKWYKDAKILQAVDTNLGMHQALDVIDLHKTLVEQGYIKTSLIKKPTNTMSDYMNLQLQCEINEANVKCLAQFDDETQKEIKQHFAAKPRLLLDSNPGLWGWLPQLFVDKKLNGKLLPTDLQKEYSYHFVTYKDVEQHLDSKIVEKLNTQSQLDDPLTKMYINAEYIKDVAPTMLFHPDWVEQAFIRGSEVKPYELAKQDGYRWRIGLDPAYHLKDQCVYWLILENIETKEFYLVDCRVMIKKYDKTLDMDITNEVEAFASINGVSGDCIATDASSNKVAEHFERFKSINIIRFKPSNPPLNTLFPEMKFENIRCESHWYFRDRLMNEAIYICIKPDSEEGQLLQRDLFRQETKPPKQDGVVRMPDKHLLPQSPDFSDSAIIGIFGTHLKAGGRYKSKSYLI